ncbi:MAG: 4Fe-4S binding protein [Calditrichaeota bacterium]|nr:MAG: 4Fe-4S binding protein [Calditrichota bacterium]
MWFVKEYDMSEQTISANRAKKVQNLRFYSQLFSVVINIWIGIQFYLFVAYVKSGGAGTSISRPPGVEGWLPIGSLVSMRYYIETGIINMIHPSGMIIFGVIILTAFLFKKGFCSWVCPVGFVSEMLGNISDKLFKRKIKPPKWLDYPLRSLKYLLLFFFVNIIIFSMTTQEIKNFIYTDYNIVSDVLMLRFFTDITPMALYIIIGLFVLSLVVRGFWCRFLCPYGALLGLLNFISPTRIVRNEKSCTNCSSCTMVCPSFIKVEKVKEVYSDECTGCLACVDSCPINKTLEVKTVRKKWSVPSIKWAAVLVLFFWGSLFAFKLFGPWQNNVPESKYFELIHQAESGSMTHP